MKEWGRSPVAASYYYKHSSLDGRRRCEKPQTWRERATVCFGDGPQGASRLDRRTAHTHKPTNTAPQNTHNNSTFSKLDSSIIFFFCFDCNTWNITSWIIIIIIIIMKEKENKFASTRSLIWKKSFFPYQEHTHTIHRWGNHFTQQNKTL